MLGIHKIGPLRANLEPVDWKKAGRTWAEKDRSVVWNSADLCTNLTSVLARRLMDGQKAGCENLPLDSTASASLAAISAFLAGQVDDNRIEELLWGLMLVRGETSQFRQHAPPTELPLPRPYALLKLLFLPFSLVVHGTEHDVRPEPSILALLSAGRVGEACRIAVRRLRASGLTPLPHARGRSRDREWEELSQSGVDGRRLAAALLLPLSEGAVKRLVKLVVRPPKAEQQLFPVVQETEDQDD